MSQVPIKQFVFQVMITEQNKGTIQGQTITVTTVFLCLSAKISFVKWIMIYNAQIGYRDFFVTPLFL